MTIICNDSKKQINVWTCRNEFKNEDMKHKVHNVLRKLYDDYIIYYIVSGNNELSDSLFDMIDYNINNIY